MLSAALINNAYERGKRSLFIARGRQLIYQKSRVLDRCGVPHAVLMEGEDHLFSQSLVTVASKDTYWSRAFASERVIMLPPDLAIVDEAHQSSSGQYQEMIPEKAVVIGLTATPIYPGDEGMGKDWSEMIVAATYSELIQAGFIVEARVFAPWAIDTRGLNKNNGDWSWDQVAKRASKLTGNVVDTWIKYGRGMSTVCFASSVEHSIALCQEFNRRGYPAVHIDADTPQEEREAAYASVASGGTCVLCNFGVLTTGFDLPSLRVGILAFSTASLVKYLQVVGRVLRSAPGKADAVVIDHGDNVRRHGWPTEDHEWSLGGAAEIQRADVEARSRDNKPPEPICCYECGALRKGGPVCPHCGARRTRHGTVVRTEEGELREIRRSDQKKTQETNDQSRLWKRCLAIAANRGMRYTQARAMYRKATGEYPPPELGYVADPALMNAKVSSLFPNFVRRKS